MKIKSFKSGKSQEGTVMKKHKKIWKIAIPAAVFVVIICVMGINSAKNADRKSVV